MNKPAIRYADFRIYLAARASQRRAGDPKPRSHLRPAGLHGRRRIPGRLAARQARVEG